MSSRPAVLEAPSAAVPVTPSAEVWRRLTEDQKLAHIVAATEALTAQAELAPEGRPHGTAKMAVASVLGDFYQRIGRAMFLASELPVLYPEEEVFAPDLIAVAGVEDQGEDDARMAWVVADEGRGVDLALEIIYRGNRDKDLVSNVARYARLGIPEYFVYDRLKLRLYGYRLAGARYASIPLRGGLLRSEVLGLDLGVVENRLRFFYGEARVPESRELIGRLDAMLGRLDATLAERERQLEEEASRRLEAEARAEAAEARAEAEAAARRAEAEARQALEARLAELLARQGGA